jgi:hypothetical protein
MCASHSATSSDQGADPEATSPPKYLLVGTTADERVIEMLAVIGEQHEWFVYHAMRATRKTLRELDLM